MAKLTSLHIKNYRSISDRIDLVIPTNAPLVLLGENNAGKSNVVRALQLLLGPFWPGSYEPDDNEFFGRDRELPIEVIGRFAGGDMCGGRFTSVTWRYQPDEDERVFYKGAPGQYGGQPYGFVSNADRDTCACVVVEADRNLRYQLGYSSKWTFLSRLMHRFHRQLTQYPAIKSELEAAFDQIKTSFKKIPEFRSFSTSLQEHFTQLVGSMTHRLDIDFEAYNPANFFQALDLQASENGAARTIDEMGTGEQQVLAMAFAHAFARAFHGGVILVVEEPESHLHPLAQEWLAHQLHDMCQDDLQIIITTHSPHFVDILNVEGLTLVRKTNGHTSVTQKSVADLVAHCISTGAPAARTTPDNILPFYSANATRAIIEGLFAKAVVLVEGPSEALSLPVYMAKAGLETAKEGIAIISVQGKGNLAKWRRLFTCYDIPCYIIFDNDGGDDGTATKRRDALAAVGIVATASDTLINSADWLVEDRVAVFGNDFESALRAAFPSYATLEQDAAAAGVDSKPFVARFVAERLEIDSGDGWVQMRALAAKLRSILPSTEPTAATDAEPSDDSGIPF